MAWQELSSLADANTDDCVQRQMEAGRHGDRLQLLYPLLYGPLNDALLQDNEEELDSHVWFDKPWRMPAVKTWAVILHLATNSEGIGTGMFLDDLKALIDASSTPDSIAWR